MRTGIAAATIFLGSVSSFIPLKLPDGAPTRRLIQESNRHNRDGNHALFLSADNASDGSLQKLGLNELQTLFRSAAQSQDFEKAENYSDELLRRLFKTEAPMDAEEKRQRRRQMSWRGLGASPWLVDRLDSLNYTFPTTIQICAMESVNTLLTKAEEQSDSVDAIPSLEERLAENRGDVGVMVSGATGSGKTLAYLVPLLTTLSDSLFTRQRLRISSEESVGDTSGDLVDRIAVVTSPVVRTNTRRPVRGGAIATGAALATLGKSGTDVRHPLALIVVPTRELGVQVAMMLYELIGGNIKKSADELKGKANMFKYKGPKGIRIGCILDDEEADFGLKLQTDIAITTPQYLSKLVSDGDIISNKLRVAILDEADLVLEQMNVQKLKDLLDESAADRSFSRLTLLVGASVTRSLGESALHSQIVPKGKTYLATATEYSELSESSEIVEEDSKALPFDDLRMCLDPSLTHEIVPLEGNTGLLVLTRLLRKELKSLESSTNKPRVVVFFPNEEMAKAAIVPLRNALWGDHKLGVLLPKIGVSPLSIMEQFKNFELSVLLATPTSVRGLDFPALTHVYALYLPVDDPREYIHLAGRVGRIGQLGSSQGGGKVVSILKKEDMAKMEIFAKDLGFEFTTTEPPKSNAPQQGDLDEDEDISNLDEVRRYLEDSMTLYDTTDEQ